MNVFRIQILFFEICEKFIQLANTFLKVLKMFQTNDCILKFMKFFQTPDFSEISVYFSNFMNIFQTHNHFLSSRIISDIHKHFLNSWFSLNSWIFFSYSWTFYEKANKNKKYTRWTHGPPALAMGQPKVCYALGVGACKGHIFFSGSAPSSAPSRHHVSFAGHSLWISYFFLFLYAFLGFSLVFSAFASLSLGFDNIFLGFPFLWSMAVLLRKKRKSTTCAFSRNSCFR